MTLPEEIISEIFVLSAPEEFGFNTDLEKMSTLPFLLTCRRWSEIALNTSSIWCYYTLLAERSDIPSVALTSRLQTWLQRARGVLIHLYCTGTCEQSVWNILLDKVAQWGSLEIKATGGKVELTHSKAVEFLKTSSNAIALRRLALDMPRTYRLIPPGDIDRFLDDGSSIFLPSLTSLDLGTGQMQLLARMRAPQLMDLSLDNLPEDFLGDLGSHSPLLRTVQLYFEHAIFPIAIFDKAYTLLPNVLRWDVIINNSLCVDLSSLSNTSYPKVISLAFDRFQFSVPEGTRFLSMFPRLERISTRNDVPKLLKCLSSDKLSDLNLNLPLVCPRLRSICLEGSKVSARTLLEFSRARTPKLEGSTLSRKGKDTEKKLMFEQRCLFTLRNCVWNDGYKIPDTEDLDEAGIEAIKYH